MSHRLKGHRMDTFYAQAARIFIACMKMEGDEDINETILLEANLLLLLLMKRRLTHKNRRKHRFWVWRIFEERERRGLCL